MNIILYHSSLFCSFSILLFIFNTPIIILNNNFLSICIILLGLVSSIINHKYTSNLYKWLDRIIILIGCLHHYYYLKSIIYLYLLYLALIFYLLSKFLNICLFHIYSHLLVTIINIKIIMDLNNYDSS